MSSHTLPRRTRRGLTAWHAIENVFDRVFGSTQNPLRHLGTTGFLALWLLVTSGVVLYILFDTSVEGAWRSVERLAHWPLGMGHLLRGIHHYAADLLILMVLLHLLREWLHRHEQGVRRFHWLTGVPLLIFCFISAIGGFWLAWDQLGHYSALSTAHWLDGLPLFASPLSRNFLSEAAVNDRLFSLFIFVHVGVPLLLIFGLWFHIQRLTHVAMLPPRRLTAGIILTLMVLALARPVLSSAPAAIEQIPSPVTLDWILLWLHPLTDATSRNVTLTLVTVTLLLLFALPFLPHRTPRTPAAVVNPEHCSGCRYCFDDCPYGAIKMVPHPDRDTLHWLASVEPDLCVNCGICAGSCPSSTPFRSITPLMTGIDMPQLSINTLRVRLQYLLTLSAAQHPLVVFSCRHGVSCDAIQASDLHVIDLLCAGQLPPSFVEYALCQGAAGVLIAGCPGCGCEFRLGERWTAQRFGRQRHPRQRVGVPDTQVHLLFAAPSDEESLHTAIQRLRQHAAITSSLNVEMKTDENIH